MDNIHSKLETYGRYCGEALLSEHFKAMITEANGIVTAVGCDAFDPVDPSLILLDVREPEEFASGFIPGRNTLTIPRGKLGFMAIEKIAKPYGQNAPIVTCCLKGPRGALAAPSKTTSGCSAHSLRRRCAPASSGWRFCRPTRFC